MCDQDVNESYNIIDFIHEYQKHPELWNIKHPLFKNRFLKEQGYGILLKKLHKDDATIDTVKQKINLLQCSFQREYSKVLIHKKYGQPYKPMCPYYKELLFLADQINENEVATEDERSRPNSTLISVEVEEIVNVDNSHSMVEEVVQHGLASSTINPAKKKKNNTKIPNQFNINRSECTLRFLKEYRRYPCLWQKNSPDHRNQMKRESAEIELSSLFGFETIQELRAKIRSLRCTYNQEIAKIRKSQLSESDSIYTPKLLWFKFAHRFLGAENLNLVNSPSPKTKIQPKIEIEYDQDDNDGDIDDDYNENNFQDDGNDDDNQNDEYEDKSNIQTVFEEHFIEPMQISNDEIDIYTKSWAQKYRKLNPMQQTYALKAIEEILGLGMVNKLDETTSIIKCNKQETAAAATATTTTTNNDEHSISPSSNYSFTLQHSSSNQLQFAEPIEMADNDNEQQIIPMKKQCLQQQPPYNHTNKKRKLQQQQNEQQVHPPSLDEDENLAFGRYIGIQMKRMHEDVKTTFKVKCIQMAYELSSST